MWIFLLFVSAISTKATRVPYFVNYSSSSSSTAASLCKLATPPITFSKYGQKVDLTSSIHDSISAYMWVGFVRINATFLYKGCAQSRLLKRISKQTTAIRTGPGRCYSFCKTRYIGIARKLDEQHGNSTCFCINQLPDDLLEKDCTVACELPLGTVCGTNNQVSVYEKVDKPQTRPSPWTASGDKDGRCLAMVPLIPYGWYYIWSDCSRAYRKICQDGSGDVTDVDNANNAKWQTIMTECIASMHFPVDPTSTFSSVHSSNGPLWIGVVRSYSIVPVSEAIKNKESYEQGYIDTNWNLQFNNSLQIWSLCMNYSSNDSTSCTRGTEMSTQPSSSPSNSSHHTSTRNPTYPANSNTKQHSTGISTQPSSSLSTTSPTNNIQTSTSANGGSEIVQSDESNGGIVALYVVIPLLVIAIAVVTGFVIWRRRRKLPEKDLRPPETSSISPHNGSIPLKGATISQDDSTYKQADSTLRHDYLILEPVNEYAAVKDTDLDNNDNEDYDTTEGAIRRNVSGNDTGNIYNRLEDVSEDTYNHTNTVNIIVDDTYDLTGECGDENTYSTVESLSRSKKGTGTVNSGNRQTNDVDDTYNHIHVA